MYSVLRSFRHSLRSAPGSHLVVKHADAIATMGPSLFSGWLDGNLDSNAPKRCWQGANHYWFPTCQVRVVRFYHSCSPPPSPSPPHPPPPPPPPSPPASPPPPLHTLPCPLPPCQLFANFRMQWALLDLNCRRAIGVGTAGPQPGTFRAQWAPLDLSLGPSELSEHHWTSTAR